MKNALLSIYKPVGVSSFRVLSDIKKTFNTSKVGHMGTLDPLAEGVLPVAVGKYTKLIPLIKLSPKTYFVTIFFGLTSETLDSQGVDLQTLPEIKLDFVEADIVSVLDCFVGEILQVPPVYSAIKIDGKRLYQYAREGKASDLKLKARKVELFNYSDLKLDGQYLSFRLQCGNGFYVRSLVRDLAEKLSCPAFMFSLIREKVGPFDLDNSSLDSEYKLIDLASVFAESIEYDLSEDQYAKVQNGNQFELDLEDSPTVICKYEGTTVALVQVQASVAKILRLFI